MAQLSESILKVVAYFDMFNYPVTLEEIRHFLEKPVHDIAIKPALQPLLEKQLIYKLGQFYSIQNDPLLVERRINGNQLAVKHLKRAMRISRILAWCPYIRGVGISGSLSKNFAYKGSDFDFFIITAANRLWIARTFQHVFIKGLSRFGLRRLCCLNYYIDERAFEIEEKNIFTATEVATLLPARGRRSFQNFFTTNNWIYEYLPNTVFKKVPATEISAWPPKKVFEWLLDNWLGEWLDNWLMRYFSRRWQALMALGKQAPGGFILGAVIVDKHYCKPIPQHFQQRILNKFQERVADIRARYMVLVD